MEDPGAVCNLRLVAFEKKGPACSNVQVDLGVAGAPKVARREQEIAPEEGAKVSDAMAKTQGRNGEGDGAWAELARGGGHRVM